MKRRVQAIAAATMLFVSACGGDNVNQVPYSTGQPVEPLPFGCATLAGEDGLREGDGCQYDIGPGNSIRLASNGLGSYTLSIPNSPSVIRHFLNERQAYSESLTAPYNGTVSEEDFLKFVRDAGNINIEQAEDGSTTYQIPQNLAIFYWEGKDKNSDNIESHFSLIEWDSSTQIEGTQVSTN